MGLKYCYRCKEHKSKDKFSKNKAKYDGLSSECKVCSKELKITKRYKIYKSSYDEVYYRNNKEKLRDYRNKWELEKERTDESFKIGKRLRNRLRYAIGNNSKVGSAVRDLGCSLDDLKQHLELKFYFNPKSGEGMSWDNYGIKGWHIDHIKPLSSFDLTNREQFLEACHYTNLQPLWWFENLKKYKNDNRRS